MRCGNLLNVLCAAHPGAAARPVAQAQRHDVPSRCHASSVSAKREAEEATMTVTQHPDITRREARSRELATEFIRFLETGEPADRLFSPDVFCDFTLPQWRLQAQGIADAVALR